MRMQHRAGAARAHDRQVQARLRRRLARSGDGGAALVDFDDLVLRHQSLIDAADGYREPQGIVAHDGAEVAAGAQSPAAGVELVPDLGERLDELAGHTPRITNLTPGAREFTMRGAIITCVGLVTLAGGLSGQEYHVPRDTVFVQLVNPYRMYFVRKGDTLSNPVTGVAVEMQHWVKDGARLRVTVRALDLDVTRRARVDTFTVTRLGVVELINGHTPGLNERVDLLLHLPGGALTPGATWVDTLRSSHGGPKGDGLYFVARTYRVGRLFDSAGTRVAEVLANAVVHYRDSWWVDSSA